MILRLEMDGDKKYEVEIPTDTKIVEAYYGSWEDGWFVHIDGELVDSEDIKEVEE